MRRRFDGWLKFQLVTVSVNLTVLGETAKEIPALFTSADEA